MRSNTSDTIWDILSIIVSIVVTALIVLFNVKSFYIVTWGLLSDAARQLYITGTAICATLLTSFITSRTQGLLLRRFDYRLFHENSLDNLKAYSLEWRAILRIGDFKDKLSQKGINFWYIFVGLITSFTISSFAPTASSKDILYQQNIYDGASKHFEGNPGICTRVIDLTVAHSVVDSDYYWDLGNGSAYYIPANEGACPTRLAQLLVGLINTFDADSFAYMDDGVAVHRSAIGAPITLYAAKAELAPEFNKMLSQYGSSALQTKQCAPVMKRNPIRCRTGGTVRLGDNWFNLTSDDGLCQFNRQFFTRNPRTQQTMVKHMCTHGEVGQGTMVIAASGGYAHWLARGIGDTENAPTTGGDVSQETYIITCTVDARAIFEHRVVSLNLRSVNSGTRYGRFLTATGENCTGPELDRARVATAAAANWQILFQNDGSDGWMDLIFETTGGHGGRPSKVWAFPDSSNPLEDVLGLISGLVTARFNGTETYQVTTTASIYATRVGSSNRLGLLYGVPLLSAAVVLIVLVFKSYPKEYPKGAVKTEVFRSIELEDLRILFRKKGSKGADGLFVKNSHKV